MANNCLFDARISGKKKNVEEFIKMLQHKDEYKADGLGSVFSCEIADDMVLELANDEDIISVDVFGDCAWSINSAMRNKHCRNLESETKRLNVVFEAYSSEPGCQFQEYVLVDRGQVLRDDCVDYEEYWVQEYDTIEEFNEEYDKNFTEDMVNDNGDVCIGGFGDQYGQFEYFKKEHFEEV